MFCAGEGGIQLENLLEGVKKVDEPLFDYQL